MNKLGAILYNIFLALLRTVYKTLCIIVKQKKNKIILYSYPDASDSSGELFLNLVKNRENLVIIWLCECPKKVQKRLRVKVKNSTNKVVVKRKRSISGVLHFCTAKYAFTTTTFYPFFVIGYGPKVISLWHGMPIKKVGVYQGAPIASANFDYVLSTSKLYSSVMAKAFQTPKDCVLNFGLPRNDALLVPDPKIRSFLEKEFNIKKDKRLYFWLPTYRVTLNKYGLKDSSEKKSFLDEWDDNFFETLSERAKVNDVTIIIKLHPADQLNKGFPCIDEENIKIIRSVEWERMGIQLYSALAVSDGLISDLSSVLVDYMITGKPIAITIHSLDNYTRGLVPEVSSMLDEFFHITGQSTFLDFLRQDRAYGIINDEVRYLYNEQSITRENSCARLIEYFDI